MPVLRNATALNRLAFTTNVIANVTAVDADTEQADVKEVEEVESPFAKLRDATAEADYVVSEHLPGPLQDKSREEVLRGEATEARLNDVVAELGRIRYIVRPREAEWNDAVDVVRFCPSESSPRHGL